VNPDRGIYRHVSYSKLCSKNIDLKKGYPNKIAIDNPEHTQKRNCLSADKVCATPGHLWQNNQQ